MKISIQHITIAFFSCLCFNAYSQNPDSLVWPGDVNNNGIANHVDLLYVGASYNTQGEERDQITTDWVGNPAPSGWNDLFFTTEMPSFGFADCDGNGMIGMEDVLTIENNYGLTHDTLFEDQFNDIPGSFNELYFPLDEPIQAQSGDSYSIDLHLGDIYNDIQNFYGIAFTIEVNPNFVNLGSVSFAINSGWIAPNGGDLIDINKKTDNIIEVALSRINMTPVTGHGPIGTLSIVIEGNVTELSSEQEIIRLDKIHVVDEYLYAYQQIFGGNITIVNGETTSNNTVISANRPIKIFPNPSLDGKFRVSGLDTYESLSIIDITGRRTQVEMYDQEINLNSFPKGVYFLEIMTSEGKWTEKLMIH